MILYHMRQMQQCLTTAGKMFCDHNDEEETWKTGKRCSWKCDLKRMCRMPWESKCQFTLADKDRLGQIIEKQGGLSYADLKDVIHARMDRILSRKQIRFMNGNYFCVQWEIRWNNWEKLSGSSISEPEIHWVISFREKYH